MEKIMDVLEFNKITKEQFDDAYDQHLPGGWIKFAYKYFSKKTEKKDFAPRRIIIGILLGLFGTGMLGTILNFSRAIMLPVTLAYSILLTVLVFYLFSAVFGNNWRIRKIRKILGVNKYQYNQLADRFYGKD